MKIDKQRQLNILDWINSLLQKRGVRGTAYLFGGNSLISLDIIERTTKDIDFFLLLVEAPGDVVEHIKNEAEKQYKIKIDIGLNGEFNIEVKGFTWKLPKNAYSRAKHIAKYSNFDIFALDPLGILVLKCDRLNDRDQGDIETIIRTLKPPKESLIEIFEEYNALLSGNRASIDNIQENFYQLVLAIHQNIIK